MAGVDQVPKASDGILRVERNRGAVCPRPEALLHPWGTVAQAVIDPEVVVSPLLWLAIPVVVTLIAAVAIPLWNRRDRALDPTDRAARVRSALQAPAPEPRSPTSSGESGAA